MGGAERERLYTAALGELVERGYLETDLEDALARAGVSRQAFEVTFEDKDSCLFAAYDALTERLLRRANDDCDDSDAWPERIRGGLERVLDELAAEPTMAQALIRAFPAIRPTAYLRYMEFLESFTQPLSEGRALSEMEEAPPGEIEMLAIGAAEAVVFDEIEAGRASTLPALAPSILFSLLVPFVGPERALEETSRAEGSAS